MEVSRPTWKLLAPRRARKTGRKGAAAEASPHADGVDLDVAEITFADLEESSE